MVAYDSDRIVYAKLQGHGCLVPDLPPASSLSHLPPHVIDRMEVENLSAKSFDGELFAFFRAASTTRHCIDLSTYVSIDFVTDNQDLALNIDAPHLHNKFIHSQNMLNMARTELQILLEDRPVTVCWLNRSNLELADEFGKRVRRACEWHRTLNNLSVDEFVNELITDGIVYDNMSIDELIKDMVCIFLFYFFVFDL